MIRQRQDAPANRRLLLDAARRVFAEKGLSAEVKDIAAEAGLGIGTFYRNFPTKDDLVMAVLLEARDLIDAAFDEAESSNQPAVEQLRFILTRLFEAVDVYGWVLEALWAGQLPAAWDEKAREDEESNRFRALLQRAVDEGGLREALDLDIVGSMAAGPVLLSHRRSAKVPQEAAAAVFDIIMNGAGRRD